MKMVVAIVHPFAYYVKYEEKDTRHFAERSGYSKLLLEEKLDIFGRYDSDRKMIILPSNETDMTEPRFSLMTSRIKLGDRDLVISDMNPYSRLRKSIYPDWDRLASYFIEKGRIIENDVVIVGGFSIDDCVKKFIRALERTGLKPLVDPKITNLYYLWLRSEIMNWKQELNMKIKRLNSLDQERKKLQKKVLGNNKD